MRLWLDASDSDSITQSGESVSQWNDKSGNGYHVAQATAAAQPQLTTLSGKPGIFFTTDDFLDAVAGSGIIFGLNAYTIIAVGARQSRANAMNVIFVGLVSNIIAYNLRYSSTSNDIIRSNARMLAGDTIISGTGIKQPALNTPTWEISTITRNGSIVLAQQGVADQSASGLTDNPATAGATPGLTLGASWRTDAVSRTDFYAGYIFEVAIIDHAIDATERANWVAYLESKWGTS